MVICVIVLSESRLGGPHGGSHGGHSWMVLDLLAKVKDENVKARPQGKPIRYPRSPNPWNPFS
jgi:hypothetical protein